MLSPSSVRLDLIFMSALRKADIAEDILLRRQLCRSRYRPERDEEIANHVLISLRVGGIRLGIGGVNVPPVTGSNCVTVCIASFAWFG